MKRIYKYPLKDTVGQQIVSMPRGARIIAVMLQNDIICLWAEVSDTHEAHDDRRIWVFSTGHPLPALPMLHLGSLQQGTDVWHIYEER